MATSIPRPDFMYFDLGNVLLFFDHGLAMRSMAKIAGIGPDLMRAVVMDTELQIEYETGLITGEMFIERIAQHIGKSLDTREMLQAAADMFIPNLQIMPVLDHVKQAGIPIGLLSNTCQAHWEWILEQRYASVVDHFGPIILSYEARSMKPDPHIYRVAEAHAGCPPEKIFFVDDRHDNVDGARKAGWMAEPFTSADRLMDQIRHW